MSARVVLCSDLHCHAWSEFSTIVEYRGEKLNSRLVDSLQVIDRIIDYAEKHHPRHVIFCGDLFHRKRLIDVPVFNAVADAVRRLAERVYLLTILVGNHDQVRRSAAGEFSREHALDSFGSYDNVHVVDQPHVMPDCDIGLVPYADDVDTIKQGIAAVRKSKILVMHAGVSGAYTGAIEHQPLEPLSVGDLPKVPIFSGHYHRPQVIERRGAPVVYVGAPMEFVRGDGHDANRGFIVLDTSKPLDFRREKIKAPRFVSLKVSDAQMRNTDVRGNFVDVLLDGGLATADNMTALLLHHGARAVNPIPYREPVKKAARLKVRKGDGGLPSVRDLIDAVVRRAPADLDRDKLTAIAREVLQEVEAKSDA
jgi:DNA repair exonuclease SbcCD nuclease subunit